MNIRKGRVRWMKENGKKVFRMVSIVFMLAAMMCTLIACGKENPENAAEKRGTI